MKTLAAFLLLATAQIGSSAIVLTGNFSTGTPKPTLTFQEDLTFTVTGTGNVTFLIFDEWTTADSSATSLTPSPSPQNLAYQLNANSATSSNIITFADNTAATYLGVTPNDGYLSIAPIAVITGDTFTVKAGVYTFNFSSGFNPLLSGADSIFTGNVFLKSNSGSISNLVNVPASVPEPSALLLSGLGAQTLLRRRRK